MKKFLSILSLLVVFNFATAEAESHWVSLDTETISAYPFTCVSTKVTDAYGETTYKGRATKVYLGFTSAKEASSQDKLQKTPWLGVKDLDLPLENLKWTDGTVRVSENHKIEVKVPLGLSLVYRLAYDKRLIGDCRNFDGRIQKAETAVHVSAIKDYNSQCESAAVRAVQEEVRLFSKSRVSASVVGIKQITPEKEYQVHVAEYGSYKVQTAQKSYFCAINRVIKLN